MTSKTKTKTKKKKRKKKVEGENPKGRFKPHKKKKKKEKGQVENLKKWLDQEKRLATMKVDWGMQRTRFLLQPKFTSQWEDRS